MPGRGGILFLELNALLERALREYRFLTSEAYWGRVILSHPASLPPRTHRRLPLVDVEDEQ